MERSLAGKIALVTGGGSGVGAAIALALAGEGARVVIAGRRIEALNEVAGQSKLIIPIAVDVTDEESSRLLFDRIQSETGSLDIAIANAGSATSTPFQKLDLKTWQSQIDLNLTGVFLTFQHALSAMTAKNNGRLIAIASTAGLKGYPYVAAYAAAKHGVIGLVQSLALELAKTDITVNAVCPGFTETPMLERSIETIMQKTGKSHGEAVAALVASNPQKRLIQPQEIAQTVLWLCGPNSGSITGQAISISGGEV
ncbi:SDR family NAD(P)-dependent oxidoreductase [Phyllobacterium sp. OV277]|uniref:SDR family NAD(P)-dependent oxidoreductase n=1 Tax=Phyllobacterium sp. OV277 TaxID=1882772 RepID=UPI00088483E5|nr:SDR family NAD(P)-dependent oxidoreductase [Phyllobacterium sp. OV277]SDP78398.1 3-hydroxybutyrate dehydrogenase/meso-butanediol dehydrogenase / (S,S)-butanediol dehydrogenase / diacetyl reductase [Phyllobacterium sp. OV277]